MPFFVKMLQMVQNLMRDPEGNPVPVGDKGVCMREPLKVEPYNNYFLFKFKFQVESFLTVELTCNWPSIYTLGKTVPQGFFQKGFYLKKKIKVKFPHRSSTFSVCFI